MLRMRLSIRSVKTFTMVSLLLLTQLPRGINSPLDEKCDLISMPNSTWAEMSLAIPGI